MSQIDITTSQNVNITFVLASVGERMIAFFLDVLVLIAYVIVVYLILEFVFNVDVYFNTMDQWSVAAIMGVAFLPVLIYALVMESLMDGQSLGKKIMKIRVVKIDGYQCSFADYLTRWIFRGVELYMFSGIPALLTIIISKNNQRLGDMAAGTAVISLKSNVTISHTILENLKEDYIPTFPQVISFSDNDIRIIKENFQKAIKVDDRVILNRLTIKIKEILKMEYDETKFTQRQFIMTVIKDYNYYTGKEN